MLMACSDTWNEREDIKNMTIKAIYKAVLCETMTGLGQHIAKWKTALLHVR